MCLEQEIRHIVDTPLSRFLERRPVAISNHTSLNLRKHLPIAEAQSEHPIHHPGGLFQFGALGKIRRDILLKAIF